ncbi:MAG: hypothetical protein GY886_09830 [Gammaproteobacteria bacterium]|nr:hypothetical protein [Gammaproteobacteria bacterium]
MAIIREPVIVETSRVDADVMPINFSYPLKDYLINTFSDLENLANKSNEAGYDAAEAINTNERQDNQIADNERGVANNTTAINLVSTTLDNHMISRSQHGASGDIIGSENFCTLTIGGVALLAETVDAIDATTPDAIYNASETYNQEQMQLVINAVNKLSENQTLIIDSFNTLIGALKNAKQMQAN